MILNQQQIDELRAWQHEKAPGGKIVFRLNLYDGGPMAIIQGQSGFEVDRRYLCD
jgi:hypothetical protein